MPASPYPLLLADDDPDIQDVLTVLLSAEGYAVTAVSDGMQAVEAAAENDFRVALLDVSMPSLDGIGAALSLRRMLPDIAIVFHTSIDEQALRQRVTDYDAYFQKPAKIEPLLRALALLRERLTVPDSGLC